MDFFQAQDRARSRSKFLVLYFLAAVVSIIAVIYTVTIIVLRNVEGGPETPPFHWWHPEVFVIVAVATSAVILLGSFFKSLALRAGGGVVARSLGGVRVDSNTSDLAQRRLLNVVEEMAIASGIRVPEVYILPEPGINAFAAGLSTDDAAVAVTQGALSTLSRDELQGVVAHEFSHILNGDMRLNVRLIGLLFGILLLAIIGRVVLHSLRFSGGGRSRGKGGGGIAAVIIVLGLTLLIVGYVGVFFGRLIQAAVSRQREFLADASAVQFTRNPGGISGALKKIGGLATGARIQNAHATETGHMFFANALSATGMNLFATHPPLMERIRAIEPGFDGKFPPTVPAVTPAAPPAARTTIRRPPPLRPEQFIAAIAAADVATEPTAAATLIDALPPEVVEAAHDPARARAVLLALLADTADAAAGQRQSKTLGQTLSPVEIQTGAACLPLIAPLNIEQRLTLLDLTLPAVRGLPGDKLQQTLSAMDAMVLADYRVSPFEFAIQHIVRRHLRAAHRLPPEPGAAATNARVQGHDVAALLAIVARAATPSASATAYAAGARAFGLHDTDLGQRGDGASALAQLAAVLQRLERAPLTQRKKVLQAIAAAATHDGVIEPDELALLRAFAAALDCPAPLGNAMNAG